MIIIQSVIKLYSQLYIEIHQKRIIEGKEKVFESFTA